MFPGEEPAGDQSLEVAEFDRDFEGHVGGCPVDKEAGFAEEIFDCFAFLASATKRLNSGEVCCDPTKPHICSIT